MVRLRPGRGAGAAEGLVQEPHHPPDFRPAEAVADHLTLPPGPDQVVAAHQRQVLADRGLPQVEGFKFTSTSKQQLMEGLAASISAQEVRFPDNWLRAELDIFEFEHSRTGVRYSAPQGSHDDGVCALALAVRAKDKLAGRFSYRII